MRTHTQSDLISEKASSSSGATNPGARRKVLVAVLHDANTTDAVHV
jgi:hypothetical protein